MVCMQKVPSSIPCLYTEGNKTHLPDNLESHFQLYTSTSNVDVMWHLYMTLFCSGQIS